MKKLGFWMACLLSQTLWAQVNIGNNLYTENEFSLNPAMAGADYQTRVDVQATQFNMKDGLNYTGGAFFLQSGLSERLGLGLRVNTGSQSIFSHSSAEAVAACHVPLSWSQRLSFGLSFGFDWRKLTQAYSGQNTYVDPNDPLLASSSYSLTQPLASVGVTYVWSRLTVSVAAQDLFAQEQLFSDQLLGKVSYLLGGSSTKIIVNPSVMLLKQADRAAFADVNLKAIWNEQCWLQAGYRTTGNLMMGVGASFKEVNIGYAFGHPINAYGTVTTGVHELNLSFRFSKRLIDGRQAVVDEPIIEGK